MRESPFLRYIFPPNRGDEESSQKARILHVALLVTAIGVIPMGILNLQIGALGFANLLFAISLLSFSAVFLHHKGHYQLGASFLSLIIFVAITYTIIDGAALNDPGVAALPIFILLASLFFDKKAVIASTLISVGFLVVLYILNSSDVLPLSQSVTSSRVIILSILLVATGLIAWTITDLREKTIGTVLDREAWLRVSEERYRNLIQTMPIPFVIHADEKILYINPAGQETFGAKSMDEVVGMSIWEFIHPESADIAKRNLEITYKQRSTTDLEYGKMLRLNGEEFDVETIGTPLVYDGQDATQSVFQDITERKQAEMAIRESEEKFHTVFMASPYSLFITRMKDQVIVDVNSGFEKNMGYTREETIGLTANDLGILKEPDDLYTLSQKVTEEEEVGDFEVIGIRKDGTERIVSLRGAMIKLQGEPHRVIAAEDITDLKASKQALIESEARYRTLFESANDAMFIIKDDRFIDCNQAVLSKFGFAWEEIIGKHPGEISPPKQPDGQDSIAKAEALNRKVNKGSTQLFDWVHQRKDGSEFTAEVNLHQITVQDVILTLAVMRDVTERKKAEQALRASETRYRTLVNHTADGISILRGDKFIDVNATWLNMFGLTKEQVIDQTPSDFSPPNQPDGQDSIDKSRELITRALDGETQSFEWKHTRADGTNFDTEILLTVIELSGEDVVLAMVRDLTDRKLAEEAAREERQRLARDLHDAVSQTLWSASLIADVVPDLWRQDPEKGLERLGRLQQLTRGALAEMRALLLELRPRALIETQLGELLSRLVDATVSHSGAKISLTHEGDYPLPENVHVAIYRIAQEALNNAIRHAMASEIIVRLQCGPKYARLEIKDNGCGFDLESTPPGQHLGLKIMRERASSIGVSLEILSRSGEGTQVVLIWSGDAEVNDG